MPVLWQSSQRPMYIRTVWVGGFRHAILTHDDPYLIRLHARKRRPNSCFTLKTQSSRLSQQTDDIQDCLRELDLVITSDKSNINKRPTSTHTNIERLDLTDFVDEDSEDEFVIKASPQPLNEQNVNSLCFDMRNLRANKTARTNVKDTELSDRVFQWLDLAGKIDLLAPDVEKMSQPRHSWPEIRRRNNNLSKSKTAIDIHKEGDRDTPKLGDRPKEQQSGTAIDRHDSCVPTSANTIENYARQSRNARATPRGEIVGVNIKTKCKDLKENITEARQKVMSARQKVMNERNAVEKQYTVMLSKKLIPDINKNPKRQVHIFMPDLPKKSDSIITSGTESLLSPHSFKSLKQ